MAQIRIPCLVGKTNKAGLTSWYWQPSKTLASAGFKAHSLGKDEGAAIAEARRLNAEVEAWRQGGQLPIKVKPFRAQGTVGALVERYRREHLNGKKPDGRPLIRDKTREAYETALKRIEAWAGSQPLAYVTPARVRALRDATARPLDQGGIGHAPAYALLKTLRQLFAFAESVDLMPRGTNPATSFALPPPPPRAELWELDDDAAFDAAAYDLGLPGMVLARKLALYTAQREGDLIKFTEAQLQELAILNPEVRKVLAREDGKVMGWCLAQTKTSTDYRRTELALPLEPGILAEVDTAIRANRARDRAAEPRRLLTYVLVDERTGQPWKKRDFIKCYRRILAHAAKATGRQHLNELTWHDLRRTRVVRLRRQGFGKDFIGAITGLGPNTIDAMLKVYGPIDPTITAAALAATLEQPAAPAEAGKQEESA